VVVLDGVRSPTLGTEVDESRGSTGELRLIAAVLEQAIEDARRGDANAITWIASGVDLVDENGWTFSVVCHLLGVDPGWIRDLAAEQIARCPYVLRPRRAGSPTTAPATAAAA